MPNRIVAVQYTSGAGNEFVTGMNEEVWDQETATPGEHKVGGSVAGPTEVLDPLPKQLKPRRAVLRNAAGVTREVIALTAGAPIMTLGETLNLEDSDGASSVFTVVGIKSESYRRRTQQPI